MDRLDMGREIDTSAYRRTIDICAGMLDPQTRADQIRILRHKMGLPVDTGMKPRLERLRPTKRYADWIRDLDEQR